jgi:hypothetical protein
MRSRDPLLPSILLRLEGGILAIVSILFYGFTGGNWWLFAGLILVPDLSALGYLLGNAVGAHTYNSVHATLLPAALLVAGWLGHQPVMVSIALIWLTHIGVDRLLGFGLKYPTAFKDTHFGRV